MRNTKTLLDLPTRKPRTRKDMIAFLSGHFRYDTMNSWNRSTSYANRVKVGHLNLSEADRQAVYEIMDVQMVYDESGYNDMLREFDRSHNHSWQIGTNGRSGGYLVLYQGGTRLSGFKSHCIRCGQQNCREATETDKQCGRCHAEARINYDKPHMQVYSQPGLGLDGDADFEDWDTSTLRDRVELVWDFDNACERACQCFLAFARENKPKEKTVMVPRKITVAVAR